MFWAIFWAGVLVVAGLVGFTVHSCCVVASRADDAMERAMRRKQAAGDDDWPLWI